MYIYVAKILDQLIGVIFRNVAKNLVISTAQLTSIKDNGNSRVERSTGATYWVRCLNSDLRSGYILEQDQLQTLSIRILPIYRPIALIACYYCIKNLYEM